MYISTNFISMSIQKEKKAKLNPSYDDLLIERDQWKAKAHIELSKIVDHWEKYVHLMREENKLLLKRNDLMVKDHVEMKGSMELLSELRKIKIAENKSVIKELSMTKDGAALLTAEKIP